MQATVALRAMDGVNAYLSHCVLLAGGWSVHEPRAQNVGIQASGTASLVELVGLTGPAMLACACMGSGACACAALWPTAHL